MNKGALALLIHGGTENWSPERWKAPVRRGLQRPPRRAAARCRAAIRPKCIYAAVWKPAPGELAAFPNLRVIFNLGAGVDALMADKSLPKVPLVRVPVGDLTARMTEYVVLHVLMHHRQELYLRSCQREKKLAAEISMAGQRDFGRHHGAGHARIKCGRRAAPVGLSVSGWSRTPKQLDGIDCFHGRGQLDKFLGQTDILVCLLPLTPDTRRHPQSRIVQQAQPRRPDGCAGPDQCGPRRAAERTRHSGLPRRWHARRGASLDVFTEEPLPADSRFWTHPKVVLTPHNAADTDPEEISRYVARQIDRFESGGALDNVVDPARGY